MMLGRVRKDTPIAIIYTPMKLRLTLLLTLLTSLIACNSMDGDWEAMKLRANVHMTDKGHIAVPASGGTYKVWCTNYDHFWFAATGCLIEDYRPVKRPTPPYTPEEEKRLSYEATGTWIRAIIEGNTLTATLQPNDSPHERRVEVYFTVGNTGGSVTFIQPASH